MRKRAGILVVLSVLLMIGLVGCAGGNAQASNEPASTVIVNKGSDTLINLALAWAEAYQEMHSEVRISVSGGGSGIGFAALSNHTVDIANASRSIKAEEKALAEQGGLPPQEFVVARDAIGVIVNPNNPINQLTLQQISLIYQGKINNWSELGGDDRPIVRLSRETNSGTHVYFLETVVRLGNSKDKSLFSPNTLLLPSSEGIITEVSSNPNAIGYDGLGYITPAVKTLAIAEKTGGDAIMPSVETVNNKQYPIARDLYMYTPGQPTGEVKRYLDWIQSSDAQKIVLELGFVPVVSGK